MQSELLVCVILITTAILVGTVQFVLTMIQVRQTAKEVEVLAKKLNEASPILDVLSLGAGIFSFITGRIKGFFGR